MPEPVVRKVKLAELDKVLPADTRRVTPEERRKTIEWRRLGQLKMLGE